MPQIQLGKPYTQLRKLYSQLGGPFSRLGKFCTQLGKLWIQQGKSVIWIVLGSYRISWANSTRGLFLRNLRIIQMLLKKHQKGYFYKQL